MANGTTCCTKVHVLMVGLSSCLLFFKKIFSSLIVMKKNLYKHPNFDCNFTISQNGERHSQIKIVY